MTATNASTRTYVQLQPGDPAPWFHQRTASNPNFAFDTVAGRYVALCFYGSAADAEGRTAIEAIRVNRPLFDDARVSCFGVSIDPTDKDQGRVQEDLPGIHHFYDFDIKVSSLYGAVPQDQKLGTACPIRRLWVILDPTLRVLKVFPFDDHTAVFVFLENLPSPEHVAGFEVQAPILVLPNVFEPELCSKLIQLYNDQGGYESGFMRDVDGVTVEVRDRNHKVRRDYLVEDSDLKKLVQRRILHRIVPQIEKAHCFTPTRMERYLVACYAAEEGGHFRAHRDNTTAGTAHRRFAVSINLNAEFEGGEVSFPEYGSRGFKPPPGGAVVFSCSLLHAVARVTSGQRYAFLPFLYDDAAAKIREANAAMVAAGSAYRA
ncbi:2OG-Fe(II) oxygenase [Methylobacterium iners]|uniref:PKHD-type hydroxylase YbiX n=1 Tax=Methylobacterium iners TaxID=418707 RepID=A0ABQ4S2Z8_9HYPH|nr:2OG-Fe(II) oxygenase [Methylobacterium iners]GJD96542.1 PKHD-type hydroxylase YbiX [Methylobacterium iners]